jgi:hypothetical protein
MRFYLLIFHEWVPTPKPLTTRAVDLDDSLNPYPAFQVNPDLATDPIRVQSFDDQKLKEKSTVKIFLDISISKIAIY